MIGIFTSYALVADDTLEIVPVEVEEAQSDLLELDTVDSVGSSCSGCSDTFCAECEYETGDKRLTELHQLLQAYLPSDKAKRTHSDKMRASLVVRDLRSVIIGFAHNAEKQEQKIAGLHNRLMMTEEALREAQSQFEE